MTKTTRACCRALGTGATAALALFATALATLHVLRADFAPSRHMISDYAIGPFGWIMTGAFLAFSACCLMLMLGLAGAGPRTAAARIAVVLLGVAWIGLFLTAVYPADLPGGPYTESGDIHDMTFLVNVGSLVAAMLLLTAAFRRDPAWRPASRPAAWAAAFVIGAFVLQFLSFRPGAP